LVTVAETVVLCVMLPAVPVTVNVTMPLGVPPEEPLQPAITTKKSTTAAAASRPRTRSSETKKNSMASIVRNIGTTTRGTYGGKCRDTGGATSPCLVVARLSVAVAGVPVVGVTDDGETEQVDLAGAPEHVRVTAEEKLPTEVTVMVEVPVAPRATLNDAGAALMVKSAGVAVTVPVSATDCGLPEPPSARTRVAVSVVATDGV
jgi:hypothetical protein